MGEVGDCEPPIPTYNGPSELSLVGQVLGNLLMLAWLAAVWFLVFPVTIVMRDVASTMASLFRERCSKLQTLSLQAEKLGFYYDAVRVRKKWERDEVARLKGK
jgi:hypothetical protein